MGMLKTAIRTGIALKALDMVRREVAKPENQRKIQDAVVRLRGRGRPGGAGMKFGSGSKF